MNKIRKHIKKNTRIKTKQLMRPALYSLFMISGTIAAVNLMLTMGRYHAAQDEYAALREYPPAIEDTAPSAQPEREKEAAAPVAVMSSGQSQAAVPTQQSAAPQPRQDFSEINPDYVGWIRIEGTAVDYPVMQGRDNERYIDTTFRGEKNRSGAIFMDCDCREGFSAPLAILYGHNMKDGSMFASLHRYRNNDFLTEHPVITITVPDGETLTYRIFAAKVTDIYDEAFALRKKDQQTVDAYCAKLNKPESPGQVLVLSTCMSGGNEDARLLVFAAREK